MNASLAQQFPLRMPVRPVEGSWQFVDTAAFSAHLKSFEHVVERNVAQAHSWEVELYAVFDDSRVLIASSDPMAVTQGLQIFVPAAPL